MSTMPSRGCGRRRRNAPRKLHLTGGTTASPHFYGRGLRRSVQPARDTHAEVDDAPCDRKNRIGRCQRRFVEQRIPFLDRVLLQPSGKSRERNTALSGEYRPISFSWRYCFVPNLQKKCPMLRFPASKSHSSYAQLLCLSHVAIRQSPGALTFPSRMTSP